MERFYSIQNKSKEKVPELELVSLNPSMAEVIFTLMNSIKANPAMINELEWIERDMKTLNDVQNYIANLSQKEAEGEKFTQVILYSGKVAGIIDYKIEKQGDQNLAYIGYFLGPEFTGKGLATQALIKIRKLLVGQGNLTPTLRINENNIPSINVATRAGFVRVDGDMYQFFTHKKI